MKRIILLCLIASAIAPVFAQKITTDKVPVLVYRAFKSKFPASNQESWAKEGKNVYEVDFFNEKKKQSATYDSIGTWLATETEIPYNQLPKAVSAAFNKQFGGFMVQETTQVESATKGMLYELIVNKGTEGYELQFSAKGDLLEKEVAKPEGD